MTRRKTAATSKKRSRIAWVAEALSQLIQDQAPTQPTCYTYIYSVTYYRGL